MNTRKLKCLPFDMWGLWEFMEGDLEPSEMFSEFTEIPAIIGKPGRYYDRDSKICWTELPDGRAFKVKSDMFLYELEMAGYDERPLTDHERKAIETLLVYNNNGTSSKELRDRLYRDDCRRMVKSTRRGATLARMQMLREES